MPNTLAIYTRKLSREEAELGLIMIEKSRWKLFPAPGEKFALAVGNQHFEVALDAEDCICRLPLHQHYHLPTAAFGPFVDLKPGVRVSIERLGEKSYRLLAP